MAGEGYPDAPAQLVSPGLQSLKMLQGRACVSPHLLEGLELFTRRGCTNPMHNSATAIQIISLVKAFLKSMI